MKFNIILLIYCFEFFIGYLKSTSTTTATTTLATASTSTESASGFTSGVFSSFKMHNSMNMNMNMNSKFLSEKNKSKNSIKKTKVSNTNQKSKQAQVTINEDTSNRLNSDNPSVLALATPDLGLDSNGKLSTNLELKSKEQSRNLNDFNYNPVFFSGWVKFYKFNTNKSPKVITNFFKNPEFIVQHKKNQYVDLTKKDKKGEFVNIPTDVSFFATVFKDTITIAKARNNSGGFTKVYDVLNMQFIDPVMEDTPKFIGGVEDFGTNAEGECFKVKAHVAGQAVIWVFCLKEPLQKNAMMKSIRQMRLFRQREKGINYLPKISMPPTRETLDSITKQKEEMLVDPEKRKRYSGDIAKDGYWQILQDWSQCDLKCGGGTSTLQRLCIPPIADGKPCEGEAILKRRCNNQACPNAIVNQFKTNPAQLNNTVELKPVIKVLPFSDRPQRYEVSLF